MKKTLSTLITSSLLAAGVAVASTSFTAANAASFSFDMTPFTGDSVKVRYTVDDLNNSGKVQFTVGVVTDSTYKNIGDLRGVFLNIKNDSLLSDLGVSDPYGAITTTKFGPAGTVETVGNAGLNGDGNTHKFDMGFEIGENGLKGGKDDYLSATFTLFRKSGAALGLDEFLNQEFGTRVTSVGTGNNREGSSKLAAYSPVNYSGQTPTQPPAVPPSNNGGPKKIPEPATTTALGLFAVSALGTRKRKLVAQA